MASKKSIEGKRRIEEAKKFFGSKFYRELNNGYHWQVDLGNTVYNFYPSTYKWHTSFDPKRRMYKGEGLESFAKAIGFKKYG